MRELDNTVLEELVNYTKGRGHLIDLSQFHDASLPNGIICSIIFLITIYWFH